MSDLAEWLRATIKDDKAAAEEGGGGEWSTGCRCGGECRDYPGCERVEGQDITIYSEGGHNSDQAVHIARHDPRDTIARCEAELAILDEHAPADFTAYGDRLCRRCARQDEEVEADALHHWVIWPCRTVLLLAWGYRHRPGYPGPKEMP